MLGEADIPIRGIVEIHESWFCAEAVGVKFPHGCMADITSILKPVSAGTSKHDTEGPAEFYYEDKHCPELLFCGSYRLKTLTRKS